MFIYIVTEEGRNDPVALFGSKKRAFEFVESYTLSTTNPIKIIRVKDGGLYSTAEQVFEDAD